MLIPRLILFYTQGFGYNPTLSLTELARDIGNQYFKLKPNRLLWNATQICSAPLWRWSTVLFDKTISFCLMFKLLFLTKKLMYLDFSQQFITNCWVILTIWWVQSSKFKADQPPFHIARKPCFRPQQKMLCVLCSTKINDWWFMNTWLQVVDTYRPVWLSLL